MGNPAIPNEDIMSMTAEVAVDFECRSAGDDLEMNLMMAGEEFSEWHR